MTDGIIQQWLKEVDSDNEINKYGYCSLYPRDIKNLIEKIKQEIIPSKYDCKDVAWLIRKQLIGDNK